MADLTRDTGKGQLVVAMKSNGEYFRDWEVHSIEIVTDVNEPSWARIELVVRDAEQTLPLNDERFPKSGAAIDIEAGYDDETNTLFRGVLVSQGVQMRAEGESSIILNCRELAVQRPANNGIATAALSVVWGQDLLTFDAQIDRLGKEDPDSIQGRMTVSGKAEIEPGMRMSITGVGTLFEGEVWARVVHQTISDGQWVSEVEFGQPSQEHDETLVSGFVSRSGVKIEIDDERRQVIIETPSGNHLSLSDDTGGIRMSSSGDIVIEAGRDIKLSAAGDIRNEGRNIFHQASMEFKAEGMAGAELSASGITTVKGSLVSIN